MKVLVCGAFGYGNLGDNLLRDTLCKLLTKQFPSIELYVDQPHPNEELINSVDLRIIGPGGLLYDNNPTHEEYLLKYAKKPFILFGVGLQFINDLKDDGLTKKLCEGAEFICLRSIKDTPHITKFTKNKLVYILPDMAFFSNVHFFHINSFPYKKDRVILCPNVSKLDLKSKLKLCEYAEKGLIDNVVSLSIEDDKFVDELSRFIDPNRTTVERYFDFPNYLFSVIDNCDLLITGRYHAGILGLLSDKTKVVSLPDKEGNVSHKLNSIIKNNINWEKLEKEKTKYIEKIEKPSKIENMDLDVIKSGKFNPAIILKDYFKKLGVSIK